MNYRIQYMAVVMSLAWTPDAFAAPTATPLSLESPDGKLAATVTIQDDDNERDCLFYSIALEGRTVVHPSRLGLEFEKQTPLTSGFSLTNTEIDEWQRDYEPVYGEKRLIANRARELTIDLEQGQEPVRRMQLVIRAYNEGVAFRYALPKQDSLASFAIRSEQTEFRFGEGDLGYEEHGTEGEYKRVPIGDIAPECQIPLTVVLRSGGYASVMEADLRGYVPSFLSPVPDVPHATRSQLRGPVQGSTPFVTPWRVVLIADEPGGLIENNHLVLNLNPPCAIDNTSWIKPGTVMRVISISTEQGKACVDFAAEHGIDYIEFDAGWYDQEWEGTSDARTPKEGLDLPYLIQYGKRHGVGIFLYVNRNALGEQLDELLPLYQGWGIRGMKFGFVHTGTQEATEWIHQAVKKAAEHQLMVDIHDQYRPTGFSRTVPNLLTQEGVRGNEHMPTAQHNVTLPFTRLVSGAADCTVCYYTDRLKNTHAHQLATSIVFYSPLQFLFWYDKPSAYQGEPEIEFFDNLPTIWDETIVLRGEIGKFISVARRSGHAWYVGSLTNQSPRTLSTPLSFLDRDKSYIAHLYTDAGHDHPTRTRVRIDRFCVDSSTEIEAAMIASGGHAMRIVPVATADCDKYPMYDH